MSKRTRRTTTQLPKLPLSMEAEINPSVAAIKRARQRPLDDCEPPPRRGPPVWEAHPSPEVREASRPIPGEPDEERIERVQRAYQAWYQRLGAEGCTDLYATALSAAIEKHPTDEELVKIMRTMDAPRVRDIARKAIAVDQAAKRDTAVEAGKHGGRYGFKGGRPSRKPPNVNIRDAHKALEQRYGYERAIGRLALVLSGKHEVSIKTARRWIVWALTSQ